MVILRRVFAILVALAIALLLATAAAAQQPSPGQHHGGAMRTQPMPQNVTPSQRLMHDTDRMMANASTMMRDLSVTHTGPHATQHLQAMSSLEAMLAHMRQVHGDRSPATARCSRISRRPWKPEWESAFGCAA